MSGSGSEPYPDTVAELAEQLQRDPVVVQQPWGSGDAAGTDARITALLGEVPFDVRVALVGTPADAEGGVDASRYLVSALARRIDEPGLYVVSAEGGPVATRVVGTAWDETLFDLQRYRDLEAVRALVEDGLLDPGVQAETVVRTALEAPPVSDGPAATSTGLAADTVQALAERQRALAPFELPDYDDDPAEPWSTGARWTVGTTVGAGLLVLLLQTRVGWPGWRRRTTSRTASATPRPSALLRPPDPTAARQEAERVLTALSERLPATTRTPQHEPAMRARDAAELLLSSDDPLDLVGALVLARAGQRALRRRSGHVLDGCFFDPRHAGPHQHLDERYGDADLVLPACRHCARDVAAGAQPAALVEPVRGPLSRTRPYYEGRTIWARTGYGTLSSDLDAFARDVLADLERRR